MSSDDSQLSTRDAGSSSRYVELKRHFAELVDLPAPEREHRLAELGERDAALASELRDLLDAEAAGAGPSLDPKRPLAVVADIDDATAASESRPPSSSATGGRFAPGEMVDARYRIVALLGRGGMGEVYRAEDLKLDEQVALKFLPIDVARDPRWLERLHGEVRTARQISHPNIVRVHDIGEAEGQAFLSMEYVDGEDLATLLRRIGALPESKALELARQLCAGVAAAHDREVLHRDLKPANVMIDGRGRAKITDFGLAQLEADAAPDQAGTPAYMAPEQLRSGEISKASDLYALGLVLYELFTGERAARTAGSEVPGLARLDDLDPNVAQTLRACLDPNPARRPKSALDVARALPGGDPIATALAAGETPSPELLRGAPVEGQLPARWGWSIWGLGLVSILFVFHSYARSSVATVDPVQLAPAVLEHRAQELLADLGIEGARYDRTYWGLSEGFLAVGEEKHTPQVWRQVAERRWPSPLALLYWQSPRPIELEALGTVQPVWRPGYSTVELDNRGRLVELVHVPEAPLGAPRSGELDWQRLWEASGLDATLFQPTAPQRVLPAEVDTHVAWSGLYSPPTDDGGTPETAPQTLLVEAAARSGEIVYWSVSETGREMPEREQPPLHLALGLVLVMLAVGAVQSIRNLRSGRGDPLGALVVGVAGALIHLSFYVVVLPEIALAGFRPLFQVLSMATFLALVLWVTYMTLEPILRRVTPTAQIAWARLVAGRISDPLVGRNYLIGAVAMASLYALLSLEFEAEFRSSGHRIQFAFPHWPGPLEGPLAAITPNIVQLMVPFGLMFLLTLPSLVLRSPTLRRPALVAGALLVIGFSVLWSGDSYLHGFGIGIVVALVGLRLGLVGLIGSTSWIPFLVLSPISVDPGLWWAPYSWLPLILGIVLTAGATWAATRRQ